MGLHKFVIQMLGHPVDDVENRFHTRVPKEFVEYGNMFGFDSIGGHSGFTILHD
jgi:hypothetical protein